MTAAAPGHALGAALALLAAASQVGAQTQTNVGVPARGEAAFGVSYQEITINERDLTILYENFGEVTLRALYFDFDYGLTDRLALNASLPFKSNRYIGNLPHDPRLLLNDHGETFLDDGNYHSNWGDFGVNLRWLWRTDPIAVTPFVGYYWPSNDYPLFTETQAGTQQWRWDAGVNAGGGLGARNFYWQAGYAYSFMEKTKPSDAPARRVNHSRLYLELGWLATPRVTSYLTVTRHMPHNALEFVDLLPGFPFSDQFYYHDQLLPWEYTTWAVGASYGASDQLTLSMSYGRTQSLTFGHYYDPAVTFSMSRGIAMGRRSRLD